MRVSKVDLLGLFTIIAILGTSHAIGDEIHFVDGSLIVGRVQSTNATGIVVSTNFAGDLTIRPEEVIGITSDRPLSVKLATGETFIGVPVYTPGQGQRMIDTPGGDVVTADAKFASVDDPAAPPPEQPPAPQEPKSEWNARLELGLTGTSGNRDRVSLRGRFEANREDEDDRTKLYAEGNYAKDGGDRTQNEIFGGVLQEWDLTERWFAFARGEAEFDEFENLDLRLTGTGGIGRFLIRKQDHELKVRGGAGVQHERFMDDTRTTDAILELGYEYRKDINKYLRFTHSLTYYPILDDPANDYRLRVETAGEVPLNKEENWKLRAGMRNDYDAMPNPGVERLDSTYFLNLVYDWK